MHFLDYKLIRDKSKQLLLNIGANDFSAESVSIGLENDLLVTLPRGDFRNLTINYTIQNNIQAPIKAGDELGLVEVISNNNIVVSESLIALEDIDEKGFFGRMIAKIILWFIGLFNFNE